MSQSEASTVVEPVAAARNLPRWNRLSAAGRRLVLAGFCVMIVAGAALGLMFWQLHTDALSEVRNNVRTLGLAIAEQTARSVQAGQLVLEDLQRQIAEQKPTSIEEFKQQASSEAIFRFLKDRADFLPQVDAFTIIAADGKLVNFSRKWPPPPTDLSDRDYLAYFRTHDSQVSFVSAPVQSRGTGGWTTYIVRRVNSPNGEFIGMVLAAMDLNYFQNFYHALTDQAPTTVTLLRQDGTVLISYPPAAEIGAVWPTDSRWHQIAADGVPEVFETKGDLTPGDRIVSVHPLKDYSLVINVSISEMFALADWRRIALVTGFCAALAIAGGAILIRAQLIHFEKLTRSERLLADRNTTLENTERTLRQQTIQLSAGRAKVAEQSATLSAALRHMNQGILMVDSTGRVVVCNERAATMLDLPSELIAAQPQFDALVEYQMEKGEFTDPSSSIRAGNLANALTGFPLYERVRPNGDVLEVQTVLTQDGGMVRTYTDITERRKSERQVQFMAHHDALTGLYNRTAFHEEFDILVAAAARRQNGLAVFYIDLDGFKAINDTYGHALGDRLLSAVALRLRAAVRETDIVARMGGDEFAIIQPFTGATRNVAELAERMLLSVGQPFRFEDTHCSVGLSIGVALFPEHSTQPAELLHHADTALYRAKAGGKRMFCIFDPAIDAGRAAVSSLEDDLTQALNDKQFHLVYQPIVDAGTLAVIRFEALLRWTHPTLGFVQPDSFIPLIERSGLIGPIGLWVLETACKAAMSWPPEVGVSVNLSPVQFQQANLADQVEQVLLRVGLPARQLNLEITEGVLLSNSGPVTEAMTRLRQLGVRFSLDDFGTAYAGLTYLRQFAFDVLKIDRSFIQEAGRSPEGRGILSAIQALGNACNLQVVAEGVETEAELAIVRDLRCDQVQGYLIGRPSTTARLEDMDGVIASTRQPRLSLVPRA